MNRKERRRQEKRARQAGTNSRSVADALALAGQCFEKDETAKAAQIVRRVLRAAPKHFDALQFHGVIASQLSRPQEAVDAFRAAVAVRPQDSSAHFNLANALDKAGQPDAARQSYLKALEITPDDADIHVNLGAVQRALRQFDDAIASFRRAIALNPNLAWAHNNLGNALQESDALDALDAAVACFERAAALAPKAAEIRLNLAQALMRLERLDDAAAACATALDLEPESVQAHAQLGKIRAGGQDWSGAAAAHRRAVECAPGDAMIRIGLGIALRENDDLPGAIAEFERAVRDDARCAPAYYNLGGALSADGKFAEAADAFRAAATYDPEDERACNNLGLVLLDLGQDDEAEAAFRRAIEINPKHAPAHYNLHAALYRDGGLGPAIDTLKSALEANPDHERARVFLAMCQQRQGDERAAAASFEMVPLNANGANYWLDSWDYAYRNLGPSTRIFGSTAKIMAHAHAAAAIDGLTLEFGVRFGTSIRQIAARTDAIVHGFDSFQGLPEAWHENPTGDYSTHGEIPALPENVRIHVGLFADTLPPFVAAHGGPIRFMNVDCDIYSATKTILDQLNTQIIPGTVIAFDEYICNPYWREDEYKAFQEAVAAYGWRYEYLAFCPFTRQTTVRILP